MVTRSGQALVVAAAIALATGGCGGVTRPAHVVRKGPGESATAAPAGAVRVIRGWSDTLRTGAAIDAARFFALPSLLQLTPGGPVGTIRTRREVIAFDLTLPCGATLLRASRDGRYVNALFALSNRPGARCDAPGRTARTRFLIRGGKIVEWRRAADQPGDQSAVPPPVSGSAV